MKLIDITQLPFNRDSGMQRSDRSDAIFMYPADARYFNHLGTVHAAVLFTLAEATSGEFLQQQFASLDTPLGAMVRRAETKYRRPAHGAVYSRASANAADLLSLPDQVQRRGRASITVQIEIIDAADVVVTTATFEWFVAKVPSSASA